MNLTLIGMSGAGKSHIGRKLAERLGLVFLDLDEEMESEHGRHLSEILESLGDERFVAAEAKTAIERTQGNDGQLISTGGSIIYSKDAMAHLDQISHIVYLDVPFETIESRIGGSAERLGRIAGMGSMDLRQLYNSRLPLYRKYAHHTVEPAVYGLEGTLGAIVALIRETGKQ